MTGTREMRTILIVDDEERLRKGLARSLSGKDRRTFTAASGEEALGVLEGRKVDLVITDLVMPGMDGMTLVRNIRSAVPGIKVIIITAYSSAVNMKEAEELGVACYLAKPFDLAHLKSRVDECLSKKPASNGPALAGSPEARQTKRIAGMRALENAHEAPGTCPRGHRVLCFICFAGGKTLKAAAGLGRKAFPYVRPRKVMLALGRVTRAASRLSLRRLPRGR